MLEKIKRIMVLVVGAMLIPVMLTGCAKNGEAPSADSTDAAKHGNDIVIDTGYGSLYFPEQWRELLKTERKTLESSVIIDFNAVVNGTTYPLFTVTVGDDGEGSSVGVLTDKNGTTRNVYMKLIPLDMDASLSEGEQNRLYAIQEDVNYLIDNLD